MVNLSEMRRSLISFIHCVIYWLLQISIIGHICRFCSFLRRGKKQKGIQLQGGFAPWPPTGGSVPWTSVHGGLRPQTPVTCARSALAMEFELCAVLNWSLKMPADVCRQNAKNAIFAKKTSNLELRCLLTTYCKSHMGFSKNPLPDP